MDTPPFVLPVRVGTALPGQPGTLVDGALALLFDPSQVTVTYDPDVISTGEGASITGAVRVELVAGGYPLPAVQVAAAASLNLLPSGLVVPSTPGIYIVSYAVKSWVLGEGSAVTAAYFNHEMVVVQGSTGSPAIVGVANFGFASNAYAVQSSPYTSAPSGAGLTNPLTGSTVQLVAYGFPTPTAFSGGATLAAGAMVTNDTPSRLYVVTTGGTDSSSAGPTGTGQGISVGGLMYNYLGLAGTKPWFQVTALSLG